MIRALSVTSITSESVEADVTDETCDLIGPPVAQMRRMSRTIAAVAAALLLQAVAPFGPDLRVAGAQLVVPAGGDLQAALDRARRGDVILLEPGATYVGNFVLPVTPGATYVTIRSAADPSRFPANGRVGPEHAQWMPTLRSPNGAPALATAAGSHHWRLQWLAFAGNANGIGDIITLGDGSDDAQVNAASVPSSFILDGLIIRGDPIHGQKRGIALNSGYTIIRNSDIRGIKAIGQDSQAICGWNGPGPYLIENNYLEAAGENVMFGGADPAIRDLVPSDITIRGNYFTKSLTLRQQGSPWTVKNLFELKNARRVLIDGNVFERNWSAAQTGYAILFTPLNQGGRAPWTVVEDVTFQFNTVRDVAAGINILGLDYMNISRPTERIRIRHNLFYGVDAAKWGGDGRFLLIGDGPASIIVDHNTAIQTGSILHLYGERNGSPWPVRNLQFTNNIALHNEYGIVGDGRATGQASLSAYTDGVETRANVIAGANPPLYPPRNFFPSVAELMGEFVNGPANDYLLRPDSRFRRLATDSAPIGADVATIRRRMPAGLPPD